MIESFLVAGRQDVKPGTPLTYGQSITDACLGWDETQAAARGAGRRGPFPANARRARARAQLTDGASDSGVILRAMFLLRRR